LFPDARVVNDHAAQLLIGPVTVEIPESGSDVLAPLECKT
jgi:hypothetical protein